MKQMNKFGLMAVIGFFMAALTVMSCDNGFDDESYLGSIKVQLAVPEEGVDEMDFKAVKITATNTADGVSKSAGADEKGVALIEGLTTGSYNISASGIVESVDISGVEYGVMVKSKEQTVVSVQLLVVNSSEGLVIKEVFYSGHSLSYDIFGTAMMKDQFIELFNNSDKTIFLDGIYIANAWTPATADIDSAPQYSMIEDPSLDKDYLYADIVVKIPGEGYDYPLEPGQSFLISHNAINFKEEIKNAAVEYGMEVTEEQLAHIIDLSASDMEIYAVEWMQSQGREGNVYFDLNNPSVPNMDNIYYSSISDFFLLDPTGASVIVARPESELKDVYTYNYGAAGAETMQEMVLMKIPVSSVLDGMDMVNNAESARWKRFPASIDMGFGYIPDDDGSLTNFSQRRNIDEAASAAAGRCILKDTNNSSEDFEPVDPPTPKGGYPGYEL